MQSLEGKGQAAKVFTLTAFTWRGRWLSRLLASPPADVAGDEKRMRVSPESRVPRPEGEALQVVLRGR
jgi:hypothetical protein